MSWFSDVFSGGGGGGWNPFDPIGSVVGLYQEGSGSVLPASPLPMPAPTVSSTIKSGNYGDALSWAANPGGAALQQNLERDFGDSNVLTKVSKIMNDVYNPLSGTVRQLEKMDGKNIWTPRGLDAILDPTGRINESARELGEVPIARDIVTNPATDALITGVTAYLNPGYAAAYKKIRGEMLQQDPEQTVKEAGLAAGASYLGGLLSSALAPAAKVATDAAGNAMTEAAVASAEAGWETGATAASQKAAGEAAAQAMAQSAGQGAGAAATSSVPEPTGTTIPEPESMIPSGPITGQAPGIVKTVAKNVLQNAIMTPIRAAANALVPSKAQVPSWAENSIRTALNPDQGYSAALDPEMGGDTARTIYPSSAYAGTLLKRIMSTGAEGGGMGGFRAINRMRRA